MYSRVGSLVCNSLRLPKIKDLDMAHKISVNRIPLDRRGYARYGRYYGVGQKLYCVAEESSGIWKEYRAASAKHARILFESDPEITRKRNRQNQNRDPLGF